ncbi:hypothetical protein JI749_00555 [Devosia oryziradicis]|uniref:DUF945 domain-containing protein n=1 Tax=Devosia oryziradicis TaxID=2801335 RepID=A0ABX7BW49_9HYPH|nr:hypothetical protein [Devosia oryziradicis]QQR36170.1 hypothetical protein JI749_00555 [Devosia oryziradicis]
MKITKIAATMLLGGVATAVMMGQANALEAQAFADRIIEVYKTIGYDVTLGEATLDGDTITIDGGSITVVSTPEAPMETMTFDTELTFSGVVENADGSYMAESLTIPDIDTDFAEEPAGHLSLVDIRVDGFYLPAGNPVPAIGLMQLYENFSTGALSITRDGEEVISIDSIQAGSTFNPQHGATELTDLTSNFAVNNITADLSTVSEEDPSAGAVIEALGLTSITGNITGDLSWSMADGHMTVHEFLLDFADVGALNITTDISGFTPAVLDQIYAMQGAMTAGGEMTEEQSQAQMMQGMAIMQGVSIIGASVRYDDAGLAPKLLDFFASSSGADRATFVEGIKAMLPGMIAETGIPALNDVIVPPVSAFLDDPKSLEVKIAPPSPTSLLVLMAAAANPAGLISALGLAVEANTAAPAAD